MNQEIIIEKCSAIGLKVKKGDVISVIDIEGQQVADLFAVNANDQNEFFSTAVTIDCKESLEITTGDILYSNLYRPMLVIIKDDAGTNDVLIPCCRPETYRYFYSNEEYHKNCFDNINNGLASFGIPSFQTIQPLNIFRNTAIGKNKKIEIKAPVSKPGDCVVFRAEMDLVICISACSLIEGVCNAGSSKPIKVLHEKTSLT